MPRLHIIDLEYLGQPGAIASYVLETDDGLALVECGPGSTLETLTSGLSELGATTDDVKHLFLSHIHFDHAGAAGHVADWGATVHVHEVGAPHLLDPSKLIASATRIYGDDMDRLWGEIRPVPPERLEARGDGDTVRFGGLEFRAIETPGHARHHHAWAIELHGERLCFTGDAAAAVCVAAPEFISLPAPPPEFDPEAWQASLRRLRDERFDAILPTHFGRLDDVEGHLDRVSESITQHTERMSAWLAEGLDDASLRAAYEAWFLELADEASLPDEARGFYAKGSVVDMNLTGIARWWKRSQESAASST